MDDDRYLLTARQYHELYCKAFARLDEISRMAEQAMKELEELQLSMGDRAAEEADYEKGEPFESFFGMEYEPRVCALDRKTLREMFQPDFASVVIGKDKRK